MNKKPILKENKYFCPYCNELLQLLYQEEAINYYKIKLDGMENPMFELDDTEPMNNFCIVCENCLEVLDVNEEEMKEILKANKGV